MKNTLKIDFVNCQIVMDRTFAMRCQNTNSEEYAHLQRVRQDYPSFSVVRKTIKKNPNKESYKGLSFDFMEDYILTHGPEDTREAVFQEFEEMRLISQCHSKAFRYSVIKHWFLDKYPEVKNFGMPKKTEVQKETVIPMPQPEMVGVGA